MTLDGIKLREQLGQRWHAHHDYSSGPGELGQSRNSRAVVVEMLDDVQGQDGVVGFEIRRKGLGEIGLDELPFRAVQPPEGAAGNIESCGAVAGALERLEVHAPATASLQNARRWKLVHSLQ